MKARLESYARKARPKMERLEADLDRLREERDQHVRDAYRDGLPQEDIADILGLSRQMVSLIVRD